MHGVDAEVRSIDAFPGFKLRVRANGVSIDESPRLQGRRFTNALTSAAWEKPRSLGASVLAGEAMYAFTIRLANVQVMKARHAADWSVVIPSKYNLQQCSLAR